MSNTEGIELDFNNDLEKQAEAFGEKQVCSLKKIEGVEQISDFDFVVKPDTLLARRVEGVIDALNFIPQTFDPEGAEEVMDAIESDLLLREGVVTPEIERNGTHELEEGDLRKIFIDDYLYFINKKPILHEMFGVAGNGSDFNEGRML